MGKQKVLRELRRVKRSIQARAIVEKLENAVLSADKLDGPTVTAAKMLLDAAGLYEQQQSQINNSVVIDVQFADPSAAKLAGTATVAGGLLEQQAAVQHSGDPPEGRQDVPGDSLAIERGDELPPD